LIQGFIQNAEAQREKQQQILPWLCTSVPHRFEKKCSAMQLQLHHVELKSDGKETSFHCSSDISYHQISPYRRHLDILQHHHGSHVPQLDVGWRRPFSLISSSPSGSGEPAAPNSEL
jgi:hypothetical protein